MQHLHTIALDADDTLWVNEVFFREAEAEFAALLHPYLPEDEAHARLLETEIRNLPLYGYGVKGFMLSMAELALEVVPEAQQGAIVARTQELGKSMLSKEVELLPDVRETLDWLADRYRLVLATKGDLLDQERKLERSGLTDYFHHVEVMSEKAVPNYRKLIGHLDIPAEQFMMVGNSLKSDVVPVLELGGWAVHVPFRVTWVHETIAMPVVHERFWEIGGLGELRGVLSSG